jgi:hypothetical protein
MQRAYKAKTLGDTRSRVRTGWAISLIAWSWQNNQTKRLWAIVDLTLITVINSIIWSFEKWKKFALRIVWLNQIIDWGKSRFRISGWIIIARN